jgi:hypothetical protein
MLILYSITPLLGLLRNYVKYKQLDIFIFLRTPLSYLLIKYIANVPNIWKILMFERWYYFVLKTLLSIYNDDYNVKKDKYIKKYNLDYNNN